MHEVEHAVHGCSVQPQTLLALCVVYLSGMSLAINTLIRVSGQAQTFWCYQKVETFLRDATGVVVGTYGMSSRSSHENCISTYHPSVDHGALVL
jgi:hypothetical protein